MELTAMKRYSIFHLIATIVVLVVLHLLVESIVATLFIYAVFLLFLPKLIELISRIGFYETDQEVFGIGDDAHIEYGRFVKFYGPLDVLRDYAFVLIGGSIPVTISYFLLPVTVFYPLFITTVVFVCNHFIFYPWIEDIVWIFSKKDPSAKLEKLSSGIASAIVIIGLIATVAVAGLSVNTMKEKLDMNVLLSQYFEDRGERNPYADMDMNQVEPEFSKLATKAEINFNQPIVTGSIAYPGVAIKMMYQEGNIGKGKWIITVHEFTGEPEIVSETVYIGENQLELAGYSGVAQIAITVFSKTSDGGNGIFKIIDKATGTEVYSTPFTFDGHVKGTGYMVFQFENPLDLGPWEVYEEEFAWDPIDHIYFYMQTRDFDLYLQE